MKKLVISLICLFQIVTAAQLLHDKIDTVINNQAMIIDLEVNEIEISSIDSVEMIYKGDTDAGFSNEEMAFLPPNKYQLNLTPMLNDSVDFEYYFIVKMQDGSRYSLPEFFPRENSFVAEVKQNENDPKIRFLNPANKETIKDALPVILVSYEDPYEILNLNSVKINIDGKNVTKKANIFPTFVSYVPDKVLKEGNHEVKVFIKDTLGNEHIVGSKFLFEPTKPTLIDFDGTFESFYDVYSTNKDASVVSRPNSKLKNTLTLKAKSGPLRMDFKEYQTSEESSLAQKLNRRKLRFYDENKIVDLRVMDSSPVLSKFTMNGANVDGVNVKVALPGLMHLHYITGIANRKILDPNNVSANVYERKVTGVQLGLDLFAWKTRLSFVNFKDQEDSLTSAQTISDNKKQANVVASWYNQFDLWGKDTYLKSEIAGSGHFKGIAIPTSGDIGSKIPDIVNELGYEGEVPMPGVAGFLEIGTPILFKEVRFKGFSNLASSAFKSFGNSSIKQDNFDYGGKLKVRIMRSALSFSGSYKKSQNEVDKMIGMDALMAEVLDQTASTADVFPTYGETYRGGVNANAFGICNLGFNYSKGRKYKETTSNAIDNTTTTTLFTLSNLKAEMGKFKGKFNGNYSYMVYDDLVATTNAFDQNSIGIGLTTEFQPVKAKFTITNAQKNYKGVTPSVTNEQSYGVRLDYAYIPKVLNTYGSLKINTGVNNGDDDSKKKNSNKTTLKVGAIYKFPTKLFTLYNSKFYIDLTMVAAGDNLDKNDNTKNFTEQTLTFKFKTSF